MPISLLPPKREALRPESPIQAAQAMPFRQPAKLPYGGIGTLAALTGQDPGDDPVAALLQARAAVPMAGPVPGLGNTVPARMAAQPALPSIGPRLADKLAALATESELPKKAERTDRKQPDDPAAAVPAALVPQRMIDTLDRYERMKKSASASPLEPS